jgi:hypothetical protein
MSCYVALIGGLGNQMFQIATAYAYCKRHELKLVLAADTGGIPTRPTYWTSFLANCSLYIGSASPGPVWRELSFSYTEIPRGASVLQGFFQSSRYFLDSAADIRALFTPSEAIQAAVKVRYSHLLEKPYVVMHVRRGDYFDGANRPIHGILTPAYYRRAMALFPGASFLVVSDEPDWCKAQPWLSGTEVLEESDECVTLWLMAQFREFIISNSSFSWWAAWLSASTKVVAPATWFGPGGPPRWSDVYEADWIRLPIGEEPSVDLP